MLTLRNWNLECSPLRYGGDWIVAWGLVSGHPSLPADISVHTSAVVKAELADGALLLTTVSGHLYTLLPEWFDWRYRRATAECLERFGIDPGFTEACMQARVRSDQARLEEDQGSVEPEELLLEVIGTTALQALFRTAQGEPVPLKPMVHLSMVQDSVLFMDRKGRTVDFRYFPRAGWIEPYHISDGLRTIKVRNLGSECVRFGRRGRETACPAGEITAIPAAEHEWEGLFSPDVVNGKSFFHPSSGPAKEADP